jgi:ABC-type siderophore export system fused ATPase/permease subunit
MKRQKMMQLKLKMQQNNQNSITCRNYYYEWIDKKILANPFEDYRKIILNLILASYLIVVKKLSFENSFEIIDEWLKKCALKRELDFNPKTLINIALVTAYKKQIPPMSIITLKMNYKDLYFLIEQKKEQ